ncbi:nucleotidyltransferase family protein [Geminicoccus roseus]|uniref:nucleotidyltransferase family protein n=1 Tax=Geminicoccus roseus TaxID=404900 RepID=UPI0004820F54|nr:nucleotidyltransferase domain-containing protein [Geminicoccus roseus]
MHPSIAQRLPEIVALCRRCGVKRLELFGSGARGDFDPARSDADFLLEWDPDAPGGLPDRWWELDQGLRDLLGRQVDLVALGSIRNKRLLDTIRRRPREVLVA